ncbi:(2Fe-2S)-binding protein [Halomontanus rarus]|uniref:(2Fe-2S)-binding protein n=1 Tax=Halomontanus rarus TaxID=3034020 RepID=UPI0023E8C4EB|nr:(2Fe-2S)-binding protein [Halovivax sp. TS33]
MATHDIELTVNETEVELTVDSRTLLVHALRDELGYTGPKVGCESSKCGACTVELDGDAVKSCTVLAVQTDGASVRTVEGFAGEDGELHPIQEQFSAEHGLQCGYCTPGMVTTTKHLLESNPDPSREEIRKALKGNICRCTGYQNVVDAVESAAAALAPAESEGESGDGADLRTDYPTPGED